jgi:hypothetical protein
MKRYRSICCIYGVKELHNAILAQFNCLLKKALSKMYTLSLIDTGLLREVYATCVDEHLIGDRFSNILTMAHGLIQKSYIIVSYREINCIPVAYLKNCIPVAYTLKINCIPVAYFK